MYFDEIEKARYAELLKSELGKELFPNGHRVAGYYHGAETRHRIDSKYSVESIEASIRADVIDFLSRNDQHYPKGKYKRKLVVDNNLCRSEIACLNFWFAFNNHPEKLKQLLNSIGYDVREVMSLNIYGKSITKHKPIYIGFEWGGEKDYLRSHPIYYNDKPQPHTAYADFYFRFKRNDGKIQTVIGEWKYVESTGFFGRIMKPEIQEKIEKYLRFFSILNLPENIDPYELAFEPFRQITKLQILASEMEKAKEQKADVVSLLMVTPRANQSINKDIISQQLKSLGDSVFDIWGKIAPDDRFKGCYLEDLFNLAVKNESYPGKDWLDYLINRYNLAPSKLPSVQKATAKVEEILLEKGKVEELVSVPSQHFAVVDDPIEIELLQTDLRDKFLENSDEADQVGKLPINQWSVCQLDVTDGEEVWYLYNLHTDMPGTRKDRYWNILGTGEYKHWSLAEVELNIPLKSDLSMQAAFVKDENGKRYLVHRGGFRGRKKMMKRRFFMDRFNGNKISAGEGRKLQEFAVIASLDDNGEKFIQDVAGFLKEVNRIKAEFNNLS
ncbi:MAG: hypothetical protein LCH52_01765 [Bacteroidetes bacterium]|nr:hypothetical protein [Bacteroidota bacterium]